MYSFWQKTNLRSMIVGNHCHVPVLDGELATGSAQELYFCEFDGPAHRIIQVMVQGE